MLSATRNVYLKQNDKKNNIMVRISSAATIIGSSQLMFYFLGNGISLFTFV